MALSYFTHTDSLNSYKQSLQAAFQYWKKGHTCQTFEEHVHGCMQVQLLQKCTSVAYELHQNVSTKYTIHNGTAVHGEKIPLSTVSKYALNS